MRYEAIATFGLAASGLFALWSAIWVVWRLAASGRQGRGSGARIRAATDPSRPGDPERPSERASRPGGLRRGAGRSAGGRIRAATVPVSAFLTLLSSLLLWATANDVATGAASAG